MVNSFEKTLISVIISLCRIVCQWDNIILEILVIFTFLVINVANLTTATSQLEDSARAGDGNTGQSDVEAGVLLFETVDFATGYVCVRAVYGRDTVLGLVHVYAHVPIWRFAALLCEDCRRGECRCCLYIHSKPIKLNGSIAHLETQTYGH